MINEPDILGDIVVIGADQHRAAVFILEHALLRHRVGDRVVGPFDAAHRHPDLGDPRPHLAEVGIAGSQRDVDLIGGDGVVEFSADQRGRRVERIARRDDRHIVVEVDRDHVVIGIVVVPIRDLGIQHHRPLGDHDVAQLGVAVGAQRVRDQADVGDVDRVHTHLGRRDEIVDDHDTVARGRDSRGVGLETDEHEVVERDVAAVDLLVEDDAQLRIGFVVGRSNDLRTPFEGEGGIVEWRPALQIIGPRHSGHHCGQRDGEDRCHQDKGRPTCPTHAFSLLHMRP